MTISNRKGKKYYNNRVGPSNMRYIPIYVKDQKSVVPSEIGFFFCFSQVGLWQKGERHESQAIMSHSRSHALGLFTIFRLAADCISYTLRPGFSKYTKTSTTTNGLTEQFDGQKKSSTSD